MGFEREEEREREIWGVGVAMGDSEKKKEGERKWILIVCGKVYCIICKMFMWHVWIGVCKIGVLHPVLIEFNLWNKIVLYGGLIPVNRFGCLTIVTLNLKKKKKDVG